MAQKNLFYSTYRATASEELFPMLKEVDERVATLVTGNKLLGEFFVAIVDFFLSPTPPRPVRYSQEDIEMIAKEASTRGIKPNVAAFYAAIFEEVTKRGLTIYTPGMSRVSAIVFAAGVIARLIPNVTNPRGADERLFKDVARSSGKQDASRLTPSEAYMMAKMMLEDKKKRPNIPASGTPQGMGSGRGGAGGGMRSGASSLAIEAPRGRGSTVDDASDVDVIPTPFKPRSNRRGSRGRRGKMTGGGRDGQGRRTAGRAGLAKGDDAQPKDGGSAAHREKGEISSPHGRAHSTPPMPSPRFFGDSRSLFRTSNTRLALPSLGEGGGGSMNSMKDIYVGRKRQSLKASISAAVDDFLRKKATVDSVLTLLGKSAHGRGFSGVGSMGEERDDIWLLVTKLKDIEKMLTLGMIFSNLFIEQSPVEVKHRTDERYSFTTTDILDDDVFRVATNISDPLMLSYKYIAGELHRPTFEEMMKKGRSFTLLVDSSGSMSGDKFLLANSLALAIAIAATREGGRYAVIYYSSEPFFAFVADGTRAKVIYPDEREESIFKALSEAASIMEGGGTEIDNALRLYFDRVLKMIGSYENNVIAITDMEDKLTTPINLFRSNGAKMTVIAVEPSCIDSYDISCPSFITAVKETGGMLVTIRNAAEAISMLMSGKGLREVVNIERPAEEVRV